MSDKLKDALDKARYLLDEALWKIDHQSKNHNGGRICLGGIYWRVVAVANCIQPFLEQTEGNKHAAKLIDIHKLKMKDAITYANDAGFFSFNVIGWKAEFERLIEAVRADALAKLATVKESLTAQSSDHFAASGKVMLTAEQAQQIDEIVEHLLVDHPTARHHKACVEALSIIRAARAQEDTVCGFSLWLNRESWGHVVDGLMLERERSEQRKTANPESNSNIISDRCAELITQINDAGGAIRAARAQFISKKQETESPDFLEGYNAGISDSKRLLSRIQEPVGEIINKYGDPESFAEHGLEISEKIIQSLPIGSKIYASPVFETRVDIDGMVNRFLGWKLPKDFYPDCGIEFHRIGKPGNPNYGRFSYEPVGTNLFTADQAKAMFEYCCSTQPVGEKNKC